MIDPHLLKDALNAERVLVEHDTARVELHVTVRCSCGARDVTADVEPGFDVALLVAALRAKLCHATRRLDS